MLTYPFNFDNEHKIFDIFINKQTCIMTAAQKIIVTFGGFGMLNVGGNVAYAGMRAQDSKDGFARCLSFCCGMPTTFLTYFLVQEGSNEAYGVHLPSLPNPNDD
ncbi:MAG: hypothetical protein Terrestrivirus1_257 [Terrestrivirus sp.]|jgi:hypothetical protein|uniref:Uncharacterized protein n=1 Tax=Terrestrivirus sp. TaxID=2487775 RepID=A0A3G4ZP65_9VIRU|nr:MAG: hypothetical protein Terrestrivirus1_257 [Terrestrivirus sp.]